MNISEIKEIIQAAVDYGISELEVQRGDNRVRVVRGGVQQEVVFAAAPAAPRGGGKARVAPAPAAAVGVEGPTQALLQHGQGVTGLALLAESHLSIHTWPEQGYAALDVFMCGKANPDACVPILREAFKVKRVAVSELLRGQGL